MAFLTDKLQVVAFSSLFRHGILCFGLNILLKRKYWTSEGLCVSVDIQSQIGASICTM